MKRLLVLFYILLAIDLTGLSSVTSTNSLWFSDVSKITLNKKWSVHFDIGLRGNDWANRWSQQLMRPGLIYKIDENWSISFGGAYFTHFSGSYFRSEYRGWEQAVFNTSFWRFVINQRIRIEQRFIQKYLEYEQSHEYVYTNRYRYQLQCVIPINNEKVIDHSFYAVLSDEIMFNSGKSIIYNAFDQNRLAIGIGYKWTNKFTISMSYIAIYNQKNKKDAIDKYNVLSLSLFHNLEI